MFKYGKWIQFVSRVHLQRSTRGSTLSASNVVVHLSDTVGFINQLLRCFLFFLLSLQRGVLGSRQHVCDKSMRHLPESGTNSNNAGTSLCICPAPRALVQVAPSRKTHTTHQQ